MSALHFYICTQNTEYVIEELRYLKTPIVFNCHLNSWRCPTGGWLLTTPQISSVRRGMLSWVMITTPISIHRTRIRTRAAPIGKPLSVDIFIFDELPQLRDIAAIWRYGVPIFGQIKCIVCSISCRCNVRDILSGEDAHAYSFHFKLQFTTAWQIHQNKGYWSTLSVYFNVVLTHDRLESREKHADVLTVFQNILCRQMCDASGWRNQASVGESWRWLMSLLPCHTNVDSLIFLVCYLFGAINTCFISIYSGQLP